METQWKRDGRRYMLNDLMKTTATLQSKHDFPRDGYPLAGCHKERVYICKLLAPQSVIKNGS